LDAVEQSIQEARINLPPENGEEGQLELLSGLGRQILGAPGQAWEALEPQDRPLLQRFVFPAGISYSPVTGFGTAQTPLLLAICRGEEYTASQLVTLLGSSWNQIEKELKDLVTLGDIIHKKPDEFLITSSPK
jgi:hypothetical protein